MNEIRYRFRLSKPLVKSSKNENSEKWVAFIVPNFGSVWTSSVVIGQPPFDWSNIVDRSIILARYGFNNDSVIKY